MTTSDYQNVYNLNNKDINLNMGGSREFDNVPTGTANSERHEKRPFYNTYNSKDKLDGKLRKLNKGKTMEALTEREEDENEVDDIIDFLES